MNIGNIKGWLCAGLFGLLAFGTNAAVFVDSFELDGEVDPLWYKGLNSSITVANGVMTLDNLSATNSLHRAFVCRNTAWATNELSSGIEIYNFYDHDLFLDVAFGSLDGTALGSSRIVYFLGVACDAVTTSIVPTACDAGVFVQVEKLSSGAFRLLVRKQCSAGTTETYVGALSGAPDGLQVSLSGNEWALTLTGATFTSGAYNGTSSASGSFAGIGSQDFDDFYLTTGVMHIGGVVLVPGKMELESVSASLFPTVFSAGYPRACFFRKSETAITQILGADYDEWEPAFSRLSGIIGKALDEEIPKAAETNSTYFNRFKEEHPEQLVLLHYDGTARDPLSGTTTSDFFSGHWIYFAAAGITGNVPSQTNDTVISVSSTNYFELDIGRYADRTDYPDVNSDIVLYSLKPDGTPDWDNSEQVKLLDVNGANSTITVKRGCYGTTPKSFTANNARAAAHQVDGPWSYDTGLLWTYNFSTACPTNSAGKNCADVLAEDLAAHFLPGGVLEGFDGIEFDVACNYDVGWSSDNWSDMNNDGTNDGGIIGGVNTYGAGVIEFYQKIKNLLGDERLVLADGGNYLNQRAAGVINGIETEGFPTIASDTNAATWSSGLNFQNFWAQNAAVPRLNYINYRQVSPSFSYNRLVFAASQCIDAITAWSELPVAEASDPFGIGIWDEFKKGRYNVTDWLGQPLGPAVHPTMQTSNLLAGGFETNSVVSNGYRFVTQPITCSGSDLLVVVRASGEPLTGHPASYTRLLRAYIEPTPLLRPLLGSTPHYVPMSWVNTNEFESIFYFRNVTNSNVSLTLEFEGTNNVTVDSIAAYAGPDVMVRVFERGMIVVNPSFQSYTFNLQDITPGRTYKRLWASSNQDTSVNTGGALGSNLVISALDGRFIIRGDTEETLVDDSFAETNLNAQWTADLNAVITLSDGVLHLENGGTNTARRAFIRRNTDEDGSALRGSAEVFNFFDHGVTINEKFDALGGSPADTKRISYFTGVCYDSTGNSMVPSLADDGVFFAVQKMNVAGVYSFRFVTYEQVGGSCTTTLVGNLSDAPSGVDIILNGGSWVITLADASFTGGSFAGESTATGNFSTIQESDFSDFCFSTGVLHEGPALEAGELDISQITITTTPWM